MVIKVKIDGTNHQKIFLTIFGWLSPDRSDPSERPVRPVEPANMGLCGPTSFKPPHFSLISSLFLLTVTFWLSLSLPSSPSPKP